jgi:YgiT-type zinc finger domain-containing protein
VSAVSKCPLCGMKELVKRNGKFRFTLPNSITVTVRDAKWEQCNACNEKIIGDDLSLAIEREADKHAERSSR